MESPILLHAQALVGESSKVEMATPNLANPFNTAMWLDEVRLQNLVGNPFMMKLRLALGRSPLTSDFIPFPMFGKVINSFAGSGVEAQTFVWKLPKPLYVPAGEFVVPTVFNDPADWGSGFGPQLAKVTYAGRSLSADFTPPDKLHMPWVSMYATPAHTGNLDFVEESRETDIHNPFNESLHVQRLLGRMADANFGESILPTIPREFTLVRMTDSQGRFIVRDPTPFAHLFFINERSWNLNAILPPKSFYIVTLNENFASAPFTVDNSVKAFITAVGFREVSLRP